MRLIDADVLKMLINPLGLSLTNKRSIINIIDSLPTVDTTAVENALLKKIYDELLSQPDTWPEYLEDIFYRYLEERGLYGNKT